MSAVHDTVAAQVALAGRAVVVAPDPRCTRVAGGWEAICHQTRTRARLAAPFYDLAAAKTETAEAFPGLGEFIDVQRADGITVAIAPYPMEETANV
jgi:hypothetical protein